MEFEVHVYQLQRIIYFYRLRSVEENIMFASSRQRGTHDRNASTRDRDHPTLDATDVSKTYIITISAHKLKSIKYIIYYILYTYSITINGWYNVYNIRSVPWLR